MSTPAERELARMSHELQQVMFALAEINPELVCMNTMCKSAVERRVPHVRNYQCDTNPAHKDS